MAYRKNDLVRITDRLCGFTVIRTVVAEENGYLRFMAGDRAEAIPLGTGRFTVRVIAKVLSLPAPVPPVAPLDSLDDVLLELATRDCPRDHGEVLARALDRLSRRSA